MSLSVKLASALIAALAVIVVLRWATVQAPPTPDAVHAAFTAYKQAVLASDGETAAAWLSAGTIEWYGRVQHLVLHARREEVERLSAVEKLEVLAFRQRMTADELRRLSPRALVAHAVTHGWVNKNQMQRADIGEATITGDIALANLVFDGRPTDRQQRFVAENGQWRFDQLPALAAVDENIRSAAALRRLNEDQLIVLMIESATGKKMGAEAWDPPIAAATPMVP